MFQPKYQITDLALKYLIQISEYRTMILNAKLIPKWELNLRKEALLRSTHASTSIEGNSLSLEEVTDLMIGRDVTALVKDKQEVLNYFRSLEELNSLTSEKKPRLENDDILHLHSIITKGVIKDAAHEGSYRSGKQYVLLRNRGTGEVTFLPPPTDQVPQLMNDLIDWINGNQSSVLDPVLEAAVVHYEFVRIHPFLDGNGRTARTLATLILIRRSFDTKRFFALDDFYNSDRPRYYQMLRSVHQDEYDLTHWLEYFCEGVAVSMKAVKQKIESLGNKKKDAANDMQIALDFEQIKVVEFVTKNGSIQNRQVRELLRVSNKKAYQLLQKLVALKVLASQGAGRNLKYISR